MRQKQSFGSVSPIQYFPLWSFQVSATSSILISTGSLFTTSPTATSNLFFGFAIYGFLGLAVGILEGGDLCCCAGKDSRGARPHVECVVGARGRLRLERPVERPVERPASEYAGELARVV